MSPSSMKPNMTGLNQTGLGASSPVAAELRSGRAERSSLVLDLVRAIAHKCSGRDLNVRGDDGVRFPGNTRLGRVLID